MFKDVTNNMDYSIREDSDADSSVAVVKRRLQHKKKVKFILGMLSSYLDTPE